TRLLSISTLSLSLSTRRRHTRCYRDWSSDVCSSDLSCRGCRRGPARVRRRRRRGCTRGSLRLPEALERTVDEHVRRAEIRRIAEIGRASCRERVEIGGVAVAVKEYCDEDGLGRGDGT